MKVCKFRLNMSGIWQPKHITHAWHTLQNITQITYPNHIHVCNTYWYWWIESQLIRMGFFANLAFIILSGKLNMSVWLDRMLPKHRRMHAHRLKLTLLRSAIHKKAYRCELSNCDGCICTRIFTGLEHPCTRNEN